MGCKVRRWSTVVEASESEIRAYPIIEIVTGVPLEMVSQHTASGSTTNK